MTAFLAAAANLATTERLRTAAAQPDAAPEPAVKHSPRPRTTRLAARRAQHAAHTAARAVLAAAAPPGG